MSRESLPLLFANHNIGMQQIAENYYEDFQSLYKQVQAAPKGDTAKELEINAMKALFKAAILKHRCAVDNIENRVKVYQCFINSAESLFFVAQAELKEEIAIHLDQRHIEKLKHDVISCFR